MNLKRKKFFLKEKKKAEKNNKTKQTKKWRRLCEIFFLESKFVTQEQ